jgi:MFS family permease
MFALQISSRLHRHGYHYAWVVAAVTFLVMLTTAAALGLPGAFLLPISKEHGWTTGQVSTVLAIRFALFGLMAPFSAILMSRFGIRNVVTVALVLIAGSMALATVATTVWQLFIAWGLMLGIGSGMTALVLAAVVANRWFSSRRGLVIGLLTASSATGQLAFLPLAAWLIEHYGWRMAVVPVLIACVVLVVLVFCFIRNHPADVGIMAFGEVPNVAATPTPPPQPTAPVPLTLRGPFVALREVSRNQTFWLLAGTFFICGLSTNGLIQTHFITLCGDFGLSPIPAASVLAMMGAFDFVGTILSGWLSDRYDNRKLLFWYYGLRGLSLFLLPHSTFTLYGLSIFAMFYGLDWIATVPPTVKLAGNAFGKERAPMVFGWIFAAHQIGAATASFGAGYSRTLLMTYTPALYVAGGACLIAALMALAVRQHKVSAPPATPPVQPAQA